MPADKFGLTGKVTWRLKTIPPDKQHLFDDLRDEYPDRGPEYDKKYSSLVTKYSVQKYMKNPNPLKRIFQPMIPAMGVNHNIVTNRGDALIAQALCPDTRVETSVDNANGQMIVGIGFGSEVKTVTAVNSVLGAAQGMNSGYPAVKGAFDASDDNVAQYISLWSQGSLMTNSGFPIDEATLGNGTYKQSYSQVSPTASVASTDTLQITWEITPLGA